MKLDKLNKAMKTINPFTLVIATLGIFVCTFLMTYQWNDDSSMNWVNSEEIRLNHRMAFVEILKENQILQTTNATQKATAWLMSFESDLNGLSVEEARKQGKEFAVKYVREELNNYKEADAMYLAINTNL